MGGSVMEMNLRVLLDPFFLFHQVAAEVVEHDMEFFAGMQRHELIHEIKEFDPAFSPIMAGMDLAGGDVEGGKKRRNAMALIFMGETREGTPIGHSQPALRSFQGLNARLFVNRKHDGIIRRTQVKDQSHRPLSAKIADRLTHTNCAVVAD